ncbi:hypothetical protein BT93_K1126 [Corymbia citriodora subsp. variegata]|nr:hypothetical protein BT93_K1126 [Corymbia citriodora subsp. variegata]
MSTSQALSITSLKDEVPALVADDDKRHLLGKKFNLILMDRDTPVMNGIEATKKLREMGIRSTIAGVSSNSVSQERQAFIEAGLDDYHEKPWSVTKLLSAVSVIKHKS